MISLGMRYLASMVLVPALLACRAEPKNEQSERTPAVVSATAAAAPNAPVSATAKPARVGEPAPSFTLPDLEGKPVELASFRGKTVVLEWFNPECPFVRASHTKGSLIDAAVRLTGANVVWLAINSAAPGKQGYGREKNLAGKQRYGLTHPVLLDETGAVGHLYGAARTPHLFVIDAKGVLVYRGAVDNSPDGEGESPTGEKLVRYVDEALKALASNEPVAPAETEAYGCSVKYAK